MAGVTYKQILHIGYAAFEGHHPLPVYDSGKGLTASSRRFACCRRASVRINRVDTATGYDQHPLDLSDRNP